MAAPVAWAAGRVLAHPVLPHAIAAPRRVLASSVGRISYYEDDGASGPPLVLLHGAAPTSSAYEVRGLFEAFRSERPVLAFDLPGYGFSEKRSEPFTREQYVHFIEDILADVSRRYGSTVDVIAIGLTGELAGRAVQRKARLVRSLSVIAPTGFDGPPSLTRAALVHARELAAKALDVPFLGAALHRAATAKPVLRAQLGRATRGRAAEELVRYTHAVSHQPSARFTILAAMTGALYDPAVVNDVYDVLGVHALFVHGDHPTCPPAVIDALVLRNSRFARVRIEGAHALPHVEQPFETASALRAFYATLSVKPQLRVIRGERVGRPFEGYRPRGSASHRHA
ncbi:putative alpha/beta hydrolase [Labilithrix luteola]|uniref:Putative alpha/beta hydrolase n=1 Tax=Labilithrix luteola TaxID=1391654 RepID=A0A0K1Q9H9_9BACT|nr:putative alpha/beta hydrolase [Labilithrix luteola]